MKNKVYYKMFASCIVTYGASRLSLCDLVRSEVMTFENVYKKLFLQLQNGISTTEIEIDNEKIIQELLDYNIIFKTTEPQSFPNIKTQYHIPCEIHNAIVNVSPYYDFKNVLKELCSLFVRHIEIRIKDGFQLWDSLILALQNIIDSSVQSISLYISDDSMPAIELLEEAYSNNIVAHIVIFDSKNKLNNLEKLNEKIAVVKGVLLTDKNCGTICSEYFVYNVHSYTLSLNYNSCLYKKVSIDNNGNIKNCPSMKDSFGNIKHTSLEEAINKPEFKKYWNITKEQVTKCKDCEFRNVCTDCRAYIENPEDIYSAPLKCGYNPYTCEWEEWSTNPLKQKAIDYYGMKDLVSTFS